MKAGQKWNSSNKHTTHEVSTFETQQPADNDETNQAADSYCTQQTSTEPLQHLFY